MEVKGRQQGEEEGKQSKPCENTVVDGNVSVAAATVTAHVSLCQSHLIQKHVDVFFRPIKHLCSVLLMAF